MKTNMKKYKVGIYYEEIGNVTIEAKSQEEAIDKVYNYYKTE